MRPVRIIAALVSAVTAGLLTVSAAPAAAASTSTAVVVQARPSPVIAGHPVTLSGSVGPEGVATDCADLILYSQAFARTHDLTMAPVYTTAKPSGAFSVTTRIPRSKPAGTYDITGRCGGGNIGASATLVVRAAPSATSTPAPPGLPVTNPQAPTPTAAPAGSVSAPASQLASRWVIPGLAAVGASTLAGLGMWLLYRRRHPASLSR
jgi:hypothetical protein